MSVYLAPLDNLFLILFSILIIYMILEYRVPNKSFVKIFLAYLTMFIIMMCIAFYIIGEKQEEAQPVKIVNCPHTSQPEGVKHDQ